MNLKLFLTILFFTISFAQLGKILPQDDSKNDKELQHFMAALKNALLTKDKDFIKRHITDRAFITNESFSKVSSSEFYKFYFSKAEDEKAFWSDLEFVFTIGGGKITESGEKRSYYMPYTSANANDGFAFEELGTYMIIIDKNVPAFSKPALNSNTLTTLDYDIVEWDWEHREDDFIGIKLKEKVQAYVKADKIVQANTTRCGLIYENGAWKIEYLGAFH